MRSISSLLFVAFVLCLLPVTATEARLFDSSADLGVGDNPLAVATADLNGDGHADLAVANHWSDDVSVLLGNGDGTFQATVNYEVGQSKAPTAVAIGDLNGDDNQDLAVANRNSGDVSVLLGNGDGTFQSAVDFGAGDYPRSIAIGDLDGDGNQDLVVANRNSDDVSVLLGNGDGTFQSTVDYGAGYNPRSVAIGDLDGDGNPDLATANYFGDNVSVLLGLGDGTFQAVMTFEAGDNPTSVVIDDFNGDNHLDLAVANFGDPSNNSDVSILLGNGDGTMQVAMNCEIAKGPQSVAVGYLDGDDIPDLAVLDQSSQDVAVLLGNGDGTFEVEKYYPAGRIPYSVALGDLNGDGHLDIVATNGFGDTVSVLTSRVVTISAKLLCTPSSGTVPFNTTLTAKLSNTNIESHRRAAARIDVLTAGGMSIPNWKAGQAAIRPLETLTFNIPLTVPAFQTIVGANRITLVSEDITPAPYNQPPFPPSGDTDTDARTVTGIAP